MTERSNKIGSFADDVLNSNHKDENDGKLIEKTNDCTPSVPEGTGVDDNLDGGGGLLSVSLSREMMGPTELGHN